MANLGWCKAEGREHKLSDFHSAEVIRSSGTGAGGVKATYIGPTGIHREVCRYCGEKA